MEGEELLGRMLDFAKRRVEPEIELDPKGWRRAQCSCRTHHRPSAYLDLEITGDQCRIMDPTPEDLTMREILKDAGGDGATKKMAARKLDAAGHINAYCCDVTDSKRQARLFAALQMSKSIASIHEVERQDAKEKVAAETAEVEANAPAALAKLQQKDNAVSSLTMKEIRAIATVYFPTIPSQRLPRIRVLWWVP